MFAATLLLTTLGFDAGGRAGQMLREEGRVQLSRLSEMGRLPSSGACWKDAVRRLHDSCDGLSSDAQASVAVKLTDCFLESSGRPAAGCGDVEDRVLCTADMSPEAFQAYTVFYTHTQSICFFLRGELWHEETERTIQRLAAVSTQVSVHMEALSRFLDVSHESLLQAITDLQSWSLGEVSWFRGLAFYVAALMAALLVSASPRTNGARPWLCLVLTVNLAVEYFVLGRVLTLLGGPTEERGLRWTAWASLSRKVAAVVCVLLVVAKMLLYRDYASENNRLLRDLKTDTKRLLRQVDVSEERTPQVVVREEDTYVERPSEVVVREEDKYEESLSRRVKARPFLREYSPYDYDRVERSSTPLPHVDVSLLTKRDFYTPERRLSEDPRLNARPVVVLRPVDVSVDRSSRESSVVSNASTHSYGLRSVQRR